MGFAGGFSLCVKRSTASRTSGPMDPPGRPGKRSRQVVPSLSGRQTSRDNVHQRRAISDSYREAEGFDSRRYFASLDASCPAKRLPVCSGRFIAPTADLSATTAILLMMAMIRADKSAVGAIMQMNKISWSSRKADKSAVGAINRPLRSSVLASLDRMLLFTLQGLRWVDDTNLQCCI